jgi:hypothetical protein
VPADAPALGAYRTVTREAVLSRWLTGVPIDKKVDLIPPGWFDMFADATFATDSELDFGQFLGGQSATAGSR